MPKNALMMVHNMYMTVVGSAAELRKAADDLDTTNSAGRAAYLSKAGGKLTEERLVEMMDAETWLTAQDCMDLGLADRLAEQDADMSHAAEVLQKASLNLSQRIQMHRDLAAQLRELTASAPRSSAPAEKGPLPPVQEAPKVRSLMEVLAAGLAAQT